MTGRPNAQDEAGRGRKQPAPDGGRDSYVLAFAVAVSVKVLAAAWLLAVAGPALTRVGT